MNASAALPPLPAPRHRTLGLSVAAVVFLLDQLIKYIVTVPLQLQSRGDEGLFLLPFFDLRWIENRGISMGFLIADSNVARWLLVGMTAAIALFVAAWMWREKSRQEVFALSLVLGGEIGRAHV